MALFGFHLSLSLCILTLNTYWISYIEYIESLLTLNKRQTRCLVQSWVGWEVIKLLLLSNSYCINANTNTSIACSNPTIQIPRHIEYNSNNTYLHIITWRFPFRQVEKWLKSRYLTCSILMAAMLIWHNNERMSENGFWSPGPDLILTLHNALSNGN